MSDQSTSGSEKDNKYHVLYTPHPETANNDDSNRRKTDETEADSEEPFNSSSLLETWQKAFGMEDVQPDFYIKRKNKYFGETTESLKLLHSGMYAKFKQYERVFYKMPATWKLVNSPNECDEQTKQDEKEDGVFHDSMIIQNNSINFWKFLIFCLHIAEQWCIKYALSQYSPTPTLDGKRPVIQCEWCPALTLAMTKKSSTNYIWNKRNQYDHTKKEHVERFKEIE